MSFVAMYPIDKIPQQISSDGKEDFAEDRERWELYGAVERALQEREDSTAATGLQDGEGDAPAGPPDPQKVIETLLAARGELDVVCDLITMLEQQQFLSLPHVTKVPDPEVAHKQRTLHLAQRHSQLLGVAQRLAQGAQGLTQQAQRDDAFLLQVAELRKGWRLGRQAGSGGAFFADLSLTLSRAGGEGIDQIEAKVPILADAAGQACVVLPASAGLHGRQRVMQGPAAISAALRQRQRLLALQVIEQLIRRDAAHAVEGDGAVAALEGMAAEAVQRAKRLSAAMGAAPSDAMDIDSQEGSVRVDNSSHAMAMPAPLGAEGGCAAAADVAAFCSSDGAQSGFEAEALRLLVGMMEAARTPALVAAVRGQQAASGVLDPLLAWLSHQAERWGVGAALQQQAAALGPGVSVALAQAEDARELMACWEVRVGGALRGVVVVRGGEARWEEEGGEGRLLGRKQLGGLLAQLAGG